MVKFFNIFFLVAIVVLFIYLFKKNRLERVVSDEEYYYINEAESIESRRKYEENLNNVIIDKEHHMDFNYQVENLNSFEKLNDYLEELKKEELKINLNNISDVVDHSLKYRILLEESKKKYGSSEVDNPYRYCTMMVSLASELWALDYSKRVVSENYYNYSKKYFLNSYYDAKKKCFNEIGKNK
ncbi:hypothetical protein [Acinetobacter tandoii]|uniref:hypothetical protein n=1 Tax=Acinetobacter tandoii TaxID=202954 RepID=UPI0030170788